MNNRNEKLAALLHLSHQLGDPQRPLVILGEGNVSVRLDEHSFLIKASGSNLAALRKQDVVECRSDVLLHMLDETGLSDAEVDGQLMNSRVDAKAKKLVGEDPTLAKYSGRIFFETIDHFFS